MMETILIFAVILLAIISTILAFLVSQNSGKKFTDDELKQILVQNEEKYDQKYRNDVSDYKQKIDEKNDLVIDKLKFKAQQELQDEERKIRNFELEIQDKLAKKEALVEVRLTTIEEEKAVLSEEREKLEKTKQDIKASKEVFMLKQQKMENEIVAKLEGISSYTRQEAKDYIIQRAKIEMGNELIQLQHKMLDDAEDEANIKARNVVSLAIQRCSSEVANEMTVTSIKLNDEEDKGKLIGKGGRNIQWLEKTLGVELIIDDTPSVVTISGFSGIRRHIAKRTVEKLLEDGRVHPSAIEEMYEKAKSEIAMEIQMAGEEAVNELGIIDFPQKLIRILGRLKFRTSYGQNMLKHSIEMAKLAGLLVDEMNSAFHSKFPIDKMICIKGALLHDVGKAIDEEQMPKGNHIELGEKICDMFDLDWRIKKCISSHHATGGDVQSYEDEEHGYCIEACIVDACDNISGSRPGARKESAEAYYQRMEALERIANSVSGVQKSFIMRGSRELWVFFDPQITELTAVHEATRTIVNQINDSIKSPFKIQVSAFLENRIVEYAG
jgi:ribonucrease Y